MALECRSNDTVPFEGSVNRVLLESATGVGQFSPLTPSHLAAVKIFSIVKVTVKGGSLQVKKSAGTIPTRPWPQSGLIIVNFSTGPVSCFIDSGAAITVVKLAMLPKEFSTADSSTC